MSDPTAPESAVRSRPVSESSYGIPEDAAGLLEWAFVGNVMTNDRSYWVATVGDDGSPHTRPVWGVWVDETFHCGGGPGTRWVRNLTENTSVSVHRQSAEDVVIIKGTAERLDADADDTRLARIDEAYEDKYGMEHGTPVFAVHPDRVLAWTDFPNDATRWTFED